jgi:RNA polymerase sigma factor (TIGR02999 family)
VDADITSKLLEREGSLGGLPSEDLLPLVYDELRSLAAAHLRGESPGQTLQATALVHEAWLRVSASGNRTWNDRTHFFRVAAQEMRRILVDTARRKACLKRGPGMQRVELAGIDASDSLPDERIILIDEALATLETDDPQSARIITLKFFGGLSNRDIATMEGVTERTIERRWAFARTRLYDLIHSKGQTGAES